MEPLSHDDLFQIFILNQQQAVMVHLGKVVHPATGKIERDLDAARFSIDLLGMLETKTRGNLSPDENRLLSHVLTTLRLNFVEEARRPEPSEERPEGRERGPDGGETPKEGAPLQEEGAPDRSGAAPEGEQDAEPGA
jgi:hypothetical protein